MNMNTKYEQHYLHFRCKIDDESEPNNSVFLAKQTIMKLLLPLQQYTRIPVHCCRTAAVEKQELVLEDFWREEQRGSV